MLKHSKIIITLLMVLPLAVTVAALFFLPDEMPAHYNAQGEVDRWGSKYEMLIFPFFIPVFGLGMSAVAHVASHGAGANESTAKAIVCANIAVLAMFDVMGLYFLINSASSPAGGTACGWTSATSCASPWAWRSSPRDSICQS